MAQGCKSGVRMNEKLRFKHRWGDYHSVPYKIKGMKALYSSCLCSRGVARLFHLKGTDDIVLEFTDRRPRGSDYYELQYSQDGHSCSDPYYHISDKLLCTTELDGFSEWEYELDLWVHTKFNHDKPIYLSLSQF